MPEVLIYDYQMNTYKVKSLEADMTEKNEWWNRVKDIVNHIGDYDGAIEDMMTKPMNYWENADEWFSRQIDTILFSALARTPEVIRDNAGEISRIERVLLGHTDIDNRNVIGEWFLKLKDGRFGYYKLKPELVWWKSLTPYDILDNIETPVFTRGQLEVALHNAHLKQRKERRRHGAYHGITRQVRPATARRQRASNCGIEGSADNCQQSDRKTV